MLDCLYIWLWTTCGGGGGGESSIQWSHRSLEDLSDLLLVAARRRPTVAAAMKLAFFYFDTVRAELHFCACASRLIGCLDFLGKYLALFFEISRSVCAENGLAC